MYNKEELTNLINNYLFPVVKKVSDNVETGCPFCNNPKNFSISLTKKVIHCWVCDSSMTLYKAFVKFSSPEGLDLYIKLTGDDGKKYNNIDYIRQKIEFEFEKQVISLPEDCIHISEIEKKPLLYNDYINYLENRFVNRLLMYKYNVYISTAGTLKNRIIFPSFDKLGNINGYIARLITDRGKLPYIIGGKKEKMIFNEFMIDFKKPIFLVEGIFDSIRLRNSIPLLGTILTEDFDLFKKIIMLNVQSIFFILDNEAQTIKNIVANCDLLKRYNKGLNIYIGEIKDKKYEDIGDMDNICVENFEFYPYDDKYKIDRLLHYKILRNG